LRNDSGSSPDYVARVNRAIDHIVQNLASPQRLEEIAKVAHLVTWAEERGLADGQWLGYMWEDPEIVALTDCRYDVGLEVPEFKPEGEVGRMDFPPMTVAQVEIKGSIDLEQRCLDWFFSTWLPHSRYVPAEQPCFEAWIGRPLAFGMEYFELHAQLPVVR